MGRMVEKRAAKLRAYIAPELSPGETVEAQLGWTQTGPTPLMSLLTNLYIFWVKYLGIVVTTKRVLVVKRSKLSARPKQVWLKSDRADARVDEWREGKLFSKLVLTVGGQQLKCNVHRMHLSEAKQVVEALTTGAKAPWNP